MNRLSLYIALIFAFMSGCLAAAGAQTDPVIAKLQRKLTSMGAYHVEFTASAEGTALSGEYTVSGNKYYIKVPGMDVLSDGRDRYEINHQTEEVLIDRISDIDHNILSNPARAFDFADDYLTSSSRTATVDGKTCDVITLTPRKEGMPVDFVELTVDRSSELPVVLKYTANGVSEQVVVRVKRIDAVNAPPASFFRFSAAAWPGYEIIDFR